MNNLYNRYIAANRYVNAIHALPPTYQTGQDLKFNQIIPDTFTKQELQRKLEEVKKAEENLKKISQLKK